MQRDDAGRYEVTSAAGESVRAFVPAPLPPDPPVLLEGALQALHERALLACGRLDGVSALLPDQALFLYAYVRREALLSSQIEGTQSSLSDLLLFELELSVTNLNKGVSHWVGRWRHDLWKHLLDNLLLQ